MSQLIDYQVLTNVFLKEGNLIIFSELTYVVN